MIDYTIEVAGWRDLNAVRKIEQECFPLDAWPLLDVIAVLTFPDTVRLKAVYKENMVGFIAGDKRRGEDLGWITTLCVSPNLRRSGIGLALLNACEKDLNAPRVRLCVRRSNYAAIQLYHHHGYVQVGVWNAYYHDGEDALILERDFSPYKLLT